MAIVLDTSSQQAGGWAKWVRAVIALVMLAVALYLFALYAATDFSPDFLAIDSCLDGGGRWSYEERRCEKG